MLDILHVCFQSIGILKSYKGYSSAMKSSIANDVEGHGAL